MPGFKDFFDSAFGSLTGYLCIASRRPQGKFTEQFFAWPEEFPSAVSYLKSKAVSENVYFCPQLLQVKKRTKENVGQVASIWADLDDCPPDKLKIAPTVVLETSPKRYQALWTLEKPIPGEEAEAIARRIAYFHADEGSDRSGWDLTQLLRIPGTHNHKYTSDEGPPRVSIIDWKPESYALSAFDVYPQAPGYEYLDIPFPDFILEKGEEILERYRFRLNGAAFTTFFRVDEAKDRSSRLFLLEMYCLEAGMQLSEVFQVCRDSVVNKFEDNTILLWKDICRAKSRFDENIRVSKSPPNDEISLLSDTEKELVRGLPETFIDRYMQWAKNVGDAAEQYHVAGAFVALSSLLAGSLALPTSFGTIAPNLWFLILADTTLTRKSTAMELATDIVFEIDENILMATDGSLEGLMTALASRDNMPSMFLRDEFTGLIDQMHKKDYMAGMAEFLAKIYDGKTQKRLLRKEEIKVKNPRLIVFGGGIKSKMMRIVSHEHVESGFLPRFIIITAMSDITKVKPLGPPETKSTTGREEIIAELKGIASRYPSSTPVVKGDKVIGMQREPTPITMEPEAWSRFNELDQTLTQIGLDSGELAEQLVPMNARLSMSILKCAMLIAASRSSGHPVVIRRHDLLKAASFGDSWRRYAQDVVANVGKGDLERRMVTILNAIQRNGSVPRSRLMQNYHISSREMTEIERTLIDRGLISKGGEGRTTTYTYLAELVMSKGIAVLSGGLDSTTMLYDLIDQGNDMKAVSFQYGQRHDKELYQASIICTDLQIEHVIINLSDFGWAISRGKSSLVNGSIPVPEGRYDAENMKSTVVPNRNMIMLTIAAGLCVAWEGEFIATAVHAGDHAIYPDCRPEFITKTEEAIKAGNLGFISPKFEIRTPYLSKTKTDIAKRADELNVPIEDTWSCYKGGAYHCGRCGTCVERQEAIYKAGVDDETIYLDTEFWKEAIKPEKVGKTDWTQPIIEL